MVNEDFIKFVSDKCTYYNIKFNLSPTMDVYQEDGLGCSGFFDESTQTLAVAQLSPDWFGILAHEFCHMCQWIENDTTWLNRGEIYPWFWDSIVGKIQIEKHLFESALVCQREVELNCEVRTVKLIKEWNLPIDIETYIKGANSYILFYTFIKEHKVWYKERPYRVPVIMDLMPTTLMNSDWYNDMPEHYEELVKQYCL